LGRGRGGRGTRDFYLGKRKGSGGRGYGTGGTLKKNTGSLERGGHRGKKKGLEGGIPNSVR